MAQPVFYQQKSIQFQIYIGLSILVLILAGYQGYSGYNKIQKINSDITMNQQVYKGLQSSNAKVEEEITTVKEANKDLAEKMEYELKLVFPDNENHTNLTRTLESFLSSNHRKQNPIMISNLHYMESVVDEENGYSILPFKMTIHSSYSNFFKFLEFVENSGTLSDKSRLIDIQSIVINFVSMKGDEENLSGQTEINFNVSMNAYFSIPAL